METKLRFRYNRQTDILYVDKCPPYQRQESEELPDEIVVRLNPNSREVEYLQVLFFSTRLMRSGRFELPVTGNLRLTGAGRIGPR